MRKENTEKNFTKTGICQSTELGRGYSRQKKIVE